MDGKKEITANKDITINDIVSYMHLIPGNEYTVKGILMNKLTGEPFLINGEKVCSEVSFTPEMPNGEVTVSFSFDSRTLTETTEIVVFETLYSNGVALTEHSDMTDEGQTVTVTVIPPVPEVPPTSDNLFGFFIGLGLAALAGIVTVAVICVIVKEAKDEDEDDYE